MCERQLICRNLAFLGETIRYYIPLSISCNSNYTNYGSMKVIIWIHNPLRF